MVTTTRGVGLADEPSPPGPGLTRFRIAAAAAAVVAVIGAGVAISGQEDSGSTIDPSNPVPIGITELPRLVPDDVPDGLVPIEVAEHGQVADLGNSVFLGHTTSGGLPVADLTISWANGESAFDPAGPRSSGFAPIVVRGHDGFSCSGDACDYYGPGVEAGVEWSEHDDQPFRLRSPSLTVDQLVAIADGLVIAGHDVPPGEASPSFVVDLDEVQLGPLPDGLPVPLEELGRSDYEGPDPVVAANGHREPIPDLRDFVNVEFWNEGLSGGLAVFVQPGQQFDLAGKLAATGAEPIGDVRGHPAWAVTLPEYGSPRERRQVFWQEAPGVIVTIKTAGTVVDLDDDVLRDVAGSLRELTGAEWQDLDAEANVAAMRLDPTHRLVGVEPIETSDDDLVVLGQ